ncbi:MAG: hypothetical protein HY927_09630 [Elusimicrobia bacterium]|nr:hypothetical protein [Elusimicrobiota bacterium]
MKTRGTSGWMLLAAVLAVPALMFYRDYRQTERLRKRAEQRKAHPGPILFPEKPLDTTTLSNPISSRGDASVAPEPAPQAPAVAAAAPRESAPQPAQPASPPAPAPVQRAPEPPKPQPPVAAASPVPAPVPVAPRVTASASTADLLASNWRDPLLSPYDQFLAQQEELLRLSKKREDDRRRTQGERRRHPRVDEAVRLQGIIEMPGGNQAIVNGETVGVGGVIAVGPDQVEVRVVRISPNGVTFSHKGKSFTARMNQ